MFVTAVRVNPILLIATVCSATLAGWLGAGVVSRLPRRRIQSIMGSALLIAATIFVMVNLGIFPAGGAAMAFVGWKFYFAVILSCGLGALMSVGIGIYAPQMIMWALLGLNPLGAFPIMMGSCGLLQPAASLRFFKSGRFDFGASLGLTMGGVPGVLIAVFIVKSLPLHVASVSAAIPRLVALLGLGDALNHRLLPESKWTTTARIKARERGKRSEHSDCRGQVLTNLNRSWFYDITVTNILRTDDLDGYRRFI